MTPEFLLGDDDLPEGPSLLGDPPPSVFEVEITDLYGNVLTWNVNGFTESQIRNYSDLSFEAGVSEERSATLTLSLYEPAIQHLVYVSTYGHIVAVLGRMIRIKYRGETEFWGLVTSPKFSTSSANGVIGCFGPTYKLRHRHVNNGDDIAGPDEQHAVHNPTDWTTVKAAVEAAYDTPDQYSENIPDIGVVVENVDATTAPDGLWTAVTRGNGNWEIIEEISQTQLVEFDIVPYDPPADELPFDTTLYEVTP